MASRSYKEPGPIDRGEALRRIDEGGDDACEALVGLVFHDTEGAFVESLCLRLIAHSSDAERRGLAVTCIGHVARIHGRLHHAETMRTLQALRADRVLGGKVEDALGDIEMFVPQRDFSP